MSKLVLRCWDHGHVVEVDIPKAKVSKFLEQCNALKKVCPHCKPENKHLHVVSNNDDSFCEFKPYQCSHGHLTLVATFGRSAQMLEVTWGADPAQRQNIKAGIEDLPDLVDNGEIVCNHVMPDGPACGQKLVACDGTTLSYPQFSSFKTKVRVEDVWRKYKALEPKTGSYDENHGDPLNPVVPKYHETEFERRNKERLKRMQRRRNIDVDRLPGTPRDK